MFQKKFYFHFILIGIFAFSVSSCIDMDKSLGDQFLPDSFKLEIKTATIPLPVAQVKSDSVQSFSSGSVAVGSLKDPVLGNSSYYAAFNIVPAADTLDYGTSQIVKKCYLTAYVASKYVLEDSDLGLIQNVSVHKMNRKIDSTTIYNNSISEVDYDPVPISYGAPIYMGTDSIKIYLNNDYAELLLAASEEEIEERSKFVDRVKGLVIKTEDPQEGGRINFILPTSIRINVEYQITDSDQNLDKRDTTDYFPCNYVALNVHNVESDHFETDDPGEYIYLQGFNGIKPHISASALRNTIEEWADQNEYDLSKIAISRASLVFPYEYDQSNFQMTNYPETIFLGERYKGGTYLAQLSHTDTIYNFIGYDVLYDISYQDIMKGTIDRSLFQYKMDANSTIQKLIKRDPDTFTNYDDIWILPYLYDSEYSTYQYDFATYFHARLNGPKHANPPVLKLVYSVIP